MARYNEMLVGRYNRMVQKLLSMKGAASLVTLADEAIAVFPLFYGAENRYLEGWDRFGGSAVVPASVGNFSPLRLRNPAGSNVLAVLERLSLSTGVTAEFEIQFGAVTTDLGTIVTAGGRLDPRGRAAPALVLSTQAVVVALGTRIFRGFLSANLQIEQISFENQEIPILPGDGIEVFLETANQQYDANFVWRERFLEESERA